MKRADLPSGVWFALVGALAALTHLGVFALLSLWWWPELANAAGFGVAFGLSFVGHRRLSFAGTSTPVGQSFYRFLITALLGFACNELVFVVLFRAWDWTPLLALLSAMVFAAGQTFLFGRFWAFKR